jgi:hypothetical protein
MHFQLAFHSNILPLHSSYSPNPALTLSILTIITTTLFLFPHTHSQSNSLSNISPHYASKNPVSKSTRALRSNKTQYHTTLPFPSLSLSIPFLFLPRIRNPFTAPHFVFPPTHSQSLSSLPDYRATFHIPIPALSNPLLLNAFSYHPSYSLPRSLFP